MAGYAPRPRDFDVDIIISYRRRDLAPFAGRIFDRLVQHYGKNSVFMDIDNVPFGIHFRKHIQNVLSIRDILIEGSDQSGLADASLGNKNSLENRLRPYRLETALQKGIPVVPVLVGSRTCPSRGMFHRACRISST